MFAGARRVSIRDFGYIDDANAKISEVTDGEFGDACRRLIADGSFVMDSEAAIRGLAALRDTAPARAVELAAGLQYAHLRLRDVQGTRSRINRVLTSKRLRLMLREERQCSSG